jgi:8-oxo-dGTP diphosphatase
MGPEKSLSTAISRNNAYAYYFHGERSHSGLVRRTRNAVRSQGFRGFESHPLRQSCFLGVRVMADRFEVVITAIIVRDGRFLILKRAATKKRFPGQWTVPGGRLEVADFAATPRESKDYWYNVLEKGLCREVAEEAGIAIRNIEYVTSLATVHQDGAPSLVISCLGEYDGGVVKLQAEEVDKSAWVSVEEAKEYNLIDGIYDELVMAAELLAGYRREWQR